MSVFSKLNEVDDAGRRRELAQEVASLFFVAEKRGLERGQISEFGHIMCRLLDALEVDERVDLSVRMSASDHAPRDLAMSLASSEIEVARPMLTSSCVLGEDDLVSIAEQNGTGHRLAISERENLTERVTDTLISFEEYAVMRSVAGNETARISETGYSTLIRHSSDDVTLTTCLARRVDLPEDAARNLMSVLDEDQRKKVALLIAQEGNTQLRKMVEIARTEASTSKISTSSQRLEGKALAREVEAGRRELGEVVLDLAQHAKPRAIASLFSEVSLLPEAKTFGALVNTDSELLMLLCRALELPFGIFSVLNGLRKRTVKLEGTRDNEDLARKYEIVSVEQARKTLRFVNLIVKAS